MKSAPEYTLQDTLVADLPDNEHDLERLQGDHAILDLPEVKDIPGQEHVRVMPLGEMADTTASSADEEGAGLLDFDEQDDDLDEDDDDDSVVLDTDDEEDMADDDLDEEDAAGTSDDDDPEADYEDEDFITEDDTDEFDDTDLDDEDDLDEEDDDLPAASMQSSSQSASTGMPINADDSALEDREAMDAEISEEEISLLENSGPVEADSDTDSLNRSKLDNVDFDGDVLNEVTSTQNVDGNDLDIPGADLDDDSEALGEEDEENNVYSMADTE